MPPSNLSTHSSKLNAPKPKSKPRSAVRTVIVTGLWTLCFLSIFDVAINRLFPYPTDPFAARPSQLKTYFEYGRSIEGKVARMIGETDQKSAELARVGWLNPNEWTPAKRPADKKRLIAVYGMSFTDQLMNEMKSLDSRLAFRRISAPSAPPNHSYAAYKLDRGKHDADVVILGILASSIKAMPTLSAMTWQFEAPALYTYPRYTLEQGKLQAIAPKVRSLAELRTALADPNSEFVAQLQNRDPQGDRAYDGFLFRRNALDHSSIVRMVRRAWAQRHLGELKKESHSPQGFAEDEMNVLRAMVSDFAATARQDGKLPIVVVLNDKGFDDHLFQALSPVFQKESIPYVSTHNIAPATDFRNFVGDGHFTKSANQRIAQAVLKLIKETGTIRKVV